VHQLTRPFADGESTVTSLHATREEALSEGELDGVWWEDEHAWLSAPHGCIISARLDRWTCRPLARNDTDELLLGI
jgi:hypothetical protein